MIMDPQFTHNLLGWMIQAMFTAGALILAAKMGLFPYVVFIRTSKDEQNPPQRPRNV